MMSYCKTSLRKQQPLGHLQLHFILIPEERVFPTFAAAFRYFCRLIFFTTRLHIVLPGRIHLSFMRV